MPTAQRRWSDQLRLAQSVLPSLRLAERETGKVAISRDGELTTKGCQRGKLRHIPLLFAARRDKILVVIVS
jgi:hypothetical protein